MLKLSRSYPQKLGLRLCKIHNKPCSLIIMLKPDGSVDKFNSTYREFFCSDCKLVLSSDDTYVDYVEVLNERHDEKTTSAL